MLDNEVIYAAGLFDGEGCILIRKTNFTKPTRNPQHSLMISVTNTNFKAVDFFKSVFQCGSIVKHIRKYPQRNCFNWVCYGTNALKVLSLMKPYIILKKGQLELAEEFMKLPTMKGKGRVSIPQDLQEARELIRIKISELNIHGDNGS